MLAITGRCGEDPEKDSVRAGMSQMTGPEQKKSEVKISRSPRHGAKVVCVYRCLFITGSEQLLGKALPNTDYKWMLSPE